MKPFPEISSRDRLLILAPHIDDEILSSAGVIQQAKQQGARILVLYATNGDYPPRLLTKRLLNPDWFISFGKNRMDEAKKATGLLGLAETNLIFLGYPDQGLKSMFLSPSAFSSPATKFSSNLYPGTYSQNQAYTGKNLTNDLVKVLIDFQPTIVFVSHPQDNHPDHKFLFSFLAKALAQTKQKPDQYAYLIHKRFYPRPGKQLRPPLRLSSNNWYSFNLSLEAKQKKLLAVQANISQLKRLSVRDLLIALVKNNEIFEKVAG